MKRLTCLLLAMLLTIGGICEGGVSEDWLRHYNELAAFCGLETLSAEDFTEGTGEDAGWFDYDPDEATGLSVSPDKDGNIVGIYVTGNTGDMNVVNLLTCAVCAADDSFTFAELLTQIKIIVTQCELMGRMRDISGQVGDWYYEGCADEDELGPYVALSFYCDRPVAYGDGSGSSDTEPDEEKPAVPAPVPTPTDKVIHKA